MRSRDADAVARLLPRLAPVAVLLTDDPDDAVRLLASALSAPRALDRPDDALVHVARSAVRRPRWAAEQILVSVPAVTGADEDTALAEAWRGLTDRARAAVALHLVAGLSPRSTAAALRGDPAAGTQAAVARLRDDLTRRDEAERRERVRAAALFRRPGSAPEPELPAPDLGQRLTLLAAGRPLPAAATETIAAAIGAARRARRRRRLRVGTGALFLGLLVALGALLPPGSGTPATPAPVSVYAGPTRGSLARDEAFLQAVRDSGWEAAAATTGSRRVVFAGDVAGGRWVLLAAGGSPARPATTAWFVGAAGAAPTRMTLLSTRVAPDPAEPVGVTDPATGALVVIAAPGDGVGVSDRPVVGADGSIVRTFRSVPVSRGAAVVRLPPVPNASLSAARLEVTRHGRRLDVHPPTVVGDPVATPPDVTSTALRPPPVPAVGDAAVAPRLRAVLGQLGEPIVGSPVTVLWSGDLPGPNDQPARLTVVAIPQPSGAVVVTTPYGYAADLAGATGSSWCGTGVLPAGVPLGQRVVAVQCDLSDLTEDREISRFLVVIAPRTATSVRLLDASATVLRERRLDDGIAVVRSPGDVAEVSVTTADGGPSSVVPLADADLAD